MKLQTHDEIRMRIEDDGVISVSTDAISKENHLEAEQLIDATFEELGGERKVLHKKPHHHHGHVHTHLTQTVTT